MTEDPDWPVTFDAARADHARRFARATPAQRLRWLEDAARIAFQTGALPRRAPATEPEEQQGDDHE